MRAPVLTHGHTTRARVCTHECLRANACMWVSPGANTCTTARACASTRASMCTPVLTYAHTMHTHVCTHVCLHADVCMWVSLCTNTCTTERACVSTRASTCAPVLTHVHTTCACVCTWSDANSHVVLPLRVDEPLVRRFHFQLCRYGIVYTVQTVGTLNLEPK